MKGWFSRFSKLTWPERRLAGAAWVRLGAARLALAIRPFRKIVNALDIHSGEVLHPPQQTHARHAAEIGLAVRRASRYTPWASSCLVQVLAAQKMLSSRGIGGAICIGGRSRGLSGETFSAHAWLRHGDVFVTGEEGHDRYTVVTSFTWCR